MTPHQIKELLKRVTYKPGVSFDFTAGSDCRPNMLRITVVADDATGLRSGPITINHISSLPPLDIVNDDEMRSLLMRAIERAEIHEAREWFKVDGVAVFYPHEADR